MGFINYYKFTQIQVADHSEPKYNSIPSSRQYVKGLKYSFLGTVINAEAERIICSEICTVTHS